MVDPLISRNRLRIAPYQAKKLQLKRNYDSSKSSVGGHFPYLSTTQGTW
jgi:hypothetical protein